MPLSPQSASTQDEECQLIHLQKDILRATLSQGNVRDTVEHICRLAEPLLPESVATVLLLNDEGRLDVFAAPNVPAEALPHLSWLQPGPETGSCGNAVMRQEPVFVADTLSDNRWRQLRPLALDFGIMACWSMPIRDSQDRVIGSFALLSFVHRSPSPFHVQVLENLALAVSLVLERQRLQEQEQLQTRTLEAISEGILITDADERIRYVNPAFTHITGYSLDDMRGQYCTVLQGFETDASTKARIRAALSRGEKFHGDILNFRKDGSPFWNELHISPVHDRDGTITHFISVQRDVSTRKTAAREQRIAAKAFEVQEGIMITDSQTHIIRVNEAFCHITGYSPEEVLGQTPAILHSGLQDPDFYRTMWDAVTRDGFWRGEILNRRKNGEAYPELLTISAVHDDESGDVQYVGYFNELTEQKRLEAELQQSLAHQQRLTQFNILLGEVNQTIARAEDERSLLHDLCNLIVHYTDIRLAWIGKPNNLGMAQALAAAGEIGCLQGIHISTRADISEGQGPFGRAWRDEKAVYDTNIRSDPTMRPWRETYLRFGMGFSSTLPIFRGGAIWAILGVNQGPEQPFETDERGILDEMARDIGFGLDRLDFIAREHEAQAFNEALLNNLTSGVEVIRYPDRIIERVNHRMLGLFGASFAEDLTGHSSREIYPNTETFQRVGEFVETVLAQGSGMLCDVPHRRLDGTPIYIDLSGHKLPTKTGEPERIVWTLVDVTERNRLTEELSRQSTTDPLTHLPNRRALETEMDRAMDRAQRNKKLLAVCMLDLDAFKPVNDSYGHESGDETLTILGKRLLAALRKTDFVARLGGDEFVILVENLSDKDALEPILNKIQEAVTAQILLSSGETIQVSMSMGIVLYPLVDLETEDQLLRKADRALYESKAHKADRECSWVFFGDPPKLFRNLAQRLLDSGALDVWYQPILDNRVCKVVGVEALARLRGEDGKIWTPAEFLPQLQEMDLFELSRQVLQQALIDLSVLDAAGFPLWVSVNVDARSISEACVECLHEMIAQFGVDPSRIVLEILEGSDFLEQPMALEHLQTLKTQGLCLALDDVGSAYASLLRMKDLPIDKIKMDQGFVRTLESRPQDLHFIRAIQELAMELKVDLVVEGVETADILDAMMTTGVPYLQGYAISRPVPFAKLQMFLTDYSPLDQELPTGLFGFYAGALSFHSAINKMLMTNPSEINSEVLSDARHCRWHGVLLRLGYGDDSPLQRIHNDYHRVLGTEARNATQNIRSIEWKMIDESLGVFLEAILSEWQKTR